MLRIACFVLLASCGDNLKASSDAGGDASADGPSARQHCIDSPTQIVKPPANELPCDLLPPGLTL